MSQNPNHTEPLHAVSVTSEMEPKKFYIDLRENGRGKYIKLKEKRGDNVNIVMIPLDCALAIADALEECHDKSRS